MGAGGGGGWPLKGVPFMTLKNLFLRQGYVKKTWPSSWRNRECLGASLLELFQGDFADGPSILAQVFSGEALLVPSV